MNFINYIFLFVAALLAAAVIFGHRYKLRRILNNMNEMLDAAIKGEFTESSFDESLLSSVESKLVQHLSASQVSSRNLEEEKERIKELISDISHQTKTPLSNILLYAQLLEEQDLEKESAACVAQLNGQAKKLGFLVDSLVKTSRLESRVLTMRPSRNEIYPMLLGIEERIRRKAEDKKIAITIKETEAHAFFDLKWTGEAVYNIVDNAVKYTPQMGKVELTVTPYDLFLRIDIADTGMGIAEEDHAKIFRRFYRSPSVHDEEGVGIGLYLSRQIISGEGGYIKVVSRPGDGAVFSVFLPREG